jgi:hypothetical protein
VAANQRITLGIDSRVVTGSAETIVTDAYLSYGFHVAPDLIWKDALPGPFNVPSNWTGWTDLQDAELIHNVTFDKPGSYTVSFPTHAVVDKLTIEQGNVTFDLLQNTLSTSQTGSFSQQGTLNITNGYFGGNGEYFGDVSTINGSVNVTSGGSLGITATVGSGGSVLASGADAAIYAPLALQGGSSLRFENGAQCAMWRLDTFENSNVDLAGAAGMGIYQIWPYIQTMNIGGTLPLPISLATLDAAIQNQGVLDLDSGTLRVQSEGDYRGRFEMEPGSKLVGDGTVVWDHFDVFAAPPNFVFNGEISPGHSIGHIGLALGGSTIHLGSSSLLTLEIGGASDYDTLEGIADDVNGLRSEIELDGSLVIRFINGYIPQAGDSWDLLTFSGISGSFSSVQFENAISGLDFDVTTNNGTWTLTAVPEPSSLALATFMIGTLAGVAWRRRKCRRPAGLCASLCMFAR